MTTAISQYKKNLKLYPWVEAFSQYEILYFFAALYFVKITDSYFITANLIALVTVTTALFEVPTGYISDKVLGRKGTFLVAQVLQVIQNIFYFIGAGGNLWYLVLGAICSGISEALHSGNMTALLYDSLHKIRRRHQFQDYLSKSKSVGLIILGLSLITAGFIANKNLNWIIYLSLATSAIGLILGLFIVEPEIVKTTKEQNLTLIKAHFKEVFYLLKSNVDLRWFCLLNILRYGLYGAAENLFFVFYKKFISFNIFGFLVAANCLISGVLSFYADRILKHLGYLRFFTLSTIVSIVVQSLAVIFSGLWSPFVLEAGALSRILENTAESSLLHHNFSDEQRATLESIVSIVRTILFSILAAIAGFMADKLGLEKVILFMILLRLVTLPIFFKALHKK